MRRHLKPLSRISFCIHQSMTLKVSYSSIFPVNFFKLLWFLLLFVPDVDISYQLLFPCAKHALILDIVCCAGDFDNVLEKRTKQVSNFLEMLRSTSKIDKEGSKTSEPPNAGWKVCYQLSN